MEKPEKITGDDELKNDPRLQAKLLYWQGWRQIRIADHLGVNEKTIRTWKSRDKWDSFSPFSRCEITTYTRYCQLIAKERKEGKDIAEIDLLARQMERFARITKYSNGGNEADLNPKVANRNSRPKKPPEKNPISEEQIEILRERFNDEIFDYQRKWLKAGISNRIRNILKSRQIGATFYFAHEAFIDALDTGRNQIFLSASKAQAHVFKSYIKAFAGSADVELKGDPILLPNGAELHFLGTNTKTAQSYHGNVYMDEYFWIGDFVNFRKVASGMAMHKKWRLTYFSTPSAVSHPAYAFWSGEAYNKGRSKDDKVKIDISHKALSDGKTCEDGQWRQIVTVMDAVDGGCNLFDINQLQQEYSPEEFENLLMCQFIDDGQSIFPLSDMQACMVDSWSVWDDFKPFHIRPFGNKSVWVGYDPSHTGDSAALVVIAPPQVDGGKFRVLDRVQFKGMDFQAQADRILAITKSYNVEYIGIDTTGIGQGVYQLTKQFFPRARAFNYSVEVKSTLVMKAMDVIRKRRLEFDAGWTDISASFMAIKKTITQSGRQFTFSAGRSEETSHSDLAWATMHALANEPLEGTNNSSKSFVVFSDAEG